jgi:hypothetical protein
VSFGSLRDVFLDASPISPPAGNARARIREDRPAATPMMTAAIGRS